MMIGACIGFLIWVVIFIIAAIQDGGKMNWDIVAVFCFAFTGSGACIGYILSRIF